MDPMNTFPQSSDMTHAPTSKVHTWMLILLTWIAVLSLVAVALLLTKNSSNGLSSSEMAAACQNGTMNGITTNLTRISEACQTQPEETMTTKNVIIKGTELYPGFIAPESWHVSGAMSNNDTYTILMSDKPNIVYFFGSDAPSETKVTIKTEPIPASITSSTQAAYVATQFPATGFENISTTPKALTAGTLYTTEADALYEIGGDVHLTVLHFITGTKVVTIIYDNTAVKTDWEIILNSLDFSSIK